MLATKDKVLNEILEKMKNYNKNEEAKKKMLLWDDNFESIERDRKRYIEVGKEEGRKEGRNSGLKQGRKEGISTGIKSVANKMMIVYNLVCKLILLTRFLIILKRGVDIK